MNGLGWVLFGLRKEENRDDLSLIMPPSYIDWIKAKFGGEVMSWDDVERLSWTGPEEVVFNRFRRKKKSSLIQFGKSKLKPSGEKMASNTDEVVKYFI